MRSWKSEYLVSGCMVTRCESSVCLVEDVNG